MSSESTELTPPKRFRLRDENGITSIEWRWVSARHALAPLFVAIACGMWWHWYSDAQKPPTTFDVWFLSITALLPPGVTYLALAKVCNRSRLVVDGDSIDLRQGPFPWPGNGHWSCSGLAGFACIAGGSPGVTWYTVYAVWQGPRLRRIAGDLRHEQEARWLASTLHQRFAPTADAMSVPLRTVP
jgi:hypothetical protein